MTVEQREYLAGWTQQASYLVHGLRGVSAMRGYVRLALWPAESQMQDWDPFTPFGAGQADAALACWGF